MPPAVPRKGGRLSPPVRQDGNCCAKMGICVVEKLHHQRVVVEQLLNDAALDALSSSVNQSNADEADRVCFAEVLVDDRCDVCRCEGVEIEKVFDWNPQRVLILHFRPVERVSRSGR
jgi:hypothetical protein